MDLPSAPETYAPHCLLVYLSNRCGMACTYCYSARSERSRRSPVVDRAAVAAAARMVAANAARKGAAMELYLHGGGEPTSQWDLLLSLRDDAAACAAAVGARICTFVATNGILPESRAGELGRRFDVIGLSCDGPPDVQDRQRPLAGGARTSRIVERTAAALLRSSANVSVRTTITPDTTERQGEIVAYLNQDLGITDLRFHPVYDTAGASLFRPDDAERFVKNFLDAVEEAKARGCSLRYSGVRPEEAHGPYCDVLSDTLHILPDNSLTACFFAVGAEARAKQIGEWDAARGEFRIDWEQLARHREQAAFLPARCAGCPAALHCARECPERCAAQAEWDAGEPGFRCRVARLLAAELIG